MCNARGMRAGGARRPPKGAYGQKRMVKMVKNEYSEYLVNI